jgi:hypothetical protein
MPFPSGLVKSVNRHLVFQKNKKHQKNEKRHHHSEVENVFIAAVQEWSDDFMEKVWYAYLVNDSDFLIESVWWFLKHLVPLMVK